jgi:hypothetical protein
MLRWLLGIFLVLHGLVHLLYVGLSRKLFEAPGIGWSPQSRIFTPLLGEARTPTLAAVLYLLSTLGFVGGGLGLLVGATWWYPVTLISAGFSALTILLFWDGGHEKLADKGLFGIIIDLAIIVALLISGGPALG